MGLVVATTLGLIVWLVLWAIGIKSIDAFLITVVIAVVGATLRIVWPMLPGNRES
jgi:hypothetical protein